MRALLWVKRGVQSWMFWVPKTWDQNVWDWAYLIKIIAAWLERAEPYHRCEGITVGSEDVADEMDYALKLCYHILANDGDSAFITDGEYYHWALRGIGKNDNIGFLMRYIGRHARTWWD